MEKNMRKLIYLKEVLLHLYNIMEFLLDLRV